MNIQEMKISLFIYASQIESKTGKLHDLLVEIMNQRCRKPDTLAHYFLEIV